MRFLFLFFSIFSTDLLAEDQASFLDVETEFILIEDPDRQASQWATCSAVYSLTADLAEKEGLKHHAEFSRDASRGAAVAVLMTKITSFLHSDAFSESEKVSQFDSRWSSAKSDMVNIPSATKNYLLMIFEGASEDEYSELGTRLAETTRICVENQKGQQAYIDIYREMVASGLLKPAPD